MNKNHGQNKINIKIIILGDSNAGKSSLILKYLEIKDSISFNTTIGFDLKKKSITLKDGTEARIMIYDTAGQERFRSLAQKYISKANGVLLVYNISDRETFQSIENWIEIIYNGGGDKLPTILIGNKSNLNDERNVSIEEGKKLAEKYGFPFYETNIKTGDNVNECFTDLAELAYKKIGKKLKEMPKALTITTTQKTHEASNFQNFNQKLKKYLFL